MRAVINKGWHNIGNTLVDFVKKDMRKPKHGKTYIIDGKRHTASAPDESPAILSGNLEKTVRYEIDGADLLFGAGDDRTDYAKFLELGTQKMEQRPFIRKAVEENFKEFEVEFEDTFKTEVRQ